MDLGLTGRVALVAGASSGLGRAAARALAAEGCAVSVCGRDPGRLAAVAGELAPARVLTRVVDVTDDAAVRTWVEETVDTLGGLHIVVTNSAGPPPGPVESFALEDYRAALDTALLPHVGLALAALPHLRAAGWGRLVMIASETVRQPIARYGLSGTARIGLAAFARTLAPSVGSAGVTVNVLAPGYHDTEGLRRQLGDRADEELARVATTIPVGRVGGAADFGAVVAMLASAHAGFVTGTTLLVDGGATKGVG